MKLGSYEVVRSLGGGGMSEALLAISPQGREVVLKRPLKADAELYGRLRDEGRLGSKLFHPNLVETLDVFDVDGVPILALGFVPGPNLDELRRASPLPAPAAARVGRQVAEALSALHGVLGDDGTPIRAVHRDVTGRNIVINPAGDAVLIDLGISKTDEERQARTETGMIIGTIRYLAPELIDGHPASSASDLWALACVVFEAATGEPTFTGPPSEVALKVSTLDPLTTAAGRRIQAPLRDVLAKLFVKDPTRRVREAHEASRLFREAEDQLGGGQQGLAARVEGMLAATAATPRTGLTPQPPGAPQPGPPPPALAPVPPELPSVRAAGAQAPQARAPELSVTGLFGPAPARAPAPAHGRDMNSGAALELDTTGRGPKRLPTDGAKRSDFYPKPKRDFSKLTGAIRTVVIWGAVIGGAWLTYLYFTDQDAQAAVAEAQAKAARDAELLRKAMEDTAPACDKDPENSMWAYEDAKGSTVVVNEASQIPKRFRKGARCVRMKR